MFVLHKNVPGIGQTSNCGETSTVFRSIRFVIHRTDVARGPLSFFISSVMLFLTLATAFLIVRNAISCLHNWIECDTRAGSRPTKCWETTRQPTQGYPTRRVNRWWAWNMREIFYNVPTTDCWYALFLLGFAYFFTISTPTTILVVAAFAKFSFLSFCLFMFLIPIRNPCMVGWASICPFLGRRKIRWSWVCLLNECYNRNT